MTESIKIQKDTPVDDIASIQAYMKTILPKVRENLSIITAEELGQDMLYHISIDPQVSLVPNVSWRRSPTEDNTVPRVRMSTTLAGCIFGYQTTIDDVITDSNGRNEGRGVFKGGYHIHAVPFTVGLRPNQKLIYDIDRSDEIWLVSHDVNQLRYKVAYRSKMVSKSATIYKSKDGIVDTLTYLVEVKPEMTIRLTKDIILTEGYYAVIQPMILNQPMLKQPKLSYAPISKAEFDKTKIERVATLNHTDKPAFSKW